jgi:LIVCS family branched-chain amino acid:cation transporter
MFFGAGNLIFPSFVGFESRSNFIPSFLGFAVTSILLPMVGINVIVKRNGLKHLGDTIAPWFSSLLTFLIYITIGPLLAIPRTSSTSFSIAVEPFIKGDTNLQILIIIYSIVFFSLSVLIAFKPDKLSSFLGKLTAPVLIVLIIIIFFSTIFSGVDSSSMAISQRYASNPFFTGFLDGYQTMDTIAALNFGIIFVVNVKAMGFKDFKEQNNVTLKASFIAGTLLFIIYLFLGAIGKVTPLESANNGTAILTYAVQSKFGIPGMVVLAIVFVLACFNTCTALISCVSDYFNSIIPSVSYKKWVVFFAVFSAIVSNAGLSAILKFSIPVLSAIYPLSITLIIIGLFNLDKNNDFKLARKLMMTFVAIFSVVPVIFNIFHQAEIFEIFPLNHIGLVWVIPGIIGLLLGYLIQLLFLKNKA